MDVPLLAGHVKKHKKHSRNGAWLPLVGIFGLTCASWYGLALLDHTVQLQHVHEEHNSFLTHHVDPTYDYGVRCSHQMKQSGLIQGVEGRDLSKITGLRRELYHKLDESLLESGLLLDSDGAQNVGADDLFQLGKGGKLVPILERLKVPVRAIVMPITDTAAGKRLYGALKRHLLPLIKPNGIWLHGPELLHSTIYHASTHMQPVPATEEEIAAELQSIQRVAQASCPITAVLERVVVTPSGTVIVCWQVASGTDPSDLRDQLKSVLPHASSQQVIHQPEILHTTLARIVDPELVPLNSGRKNVHEEVVYGPEAVVLLKDATAKMTRELCGMQTLLNEIWFVQEEDKLALGLGGKFKAENMTLECSETR